MTSLPVFLLLRHSIGLVIALVLVRRFQGAISSVVIRCIPLKRRLAEDGYLLQNRLSVIASIVLIGLVTFFVNKGVTTMATQVGWTSSTPYSSTEIARQPQIPVLQPPTLVTQRPSISTFGFLTRKDTTPPPMLQPVVQPPVVQPYVPVANPCYIQLVATGRYEKALNLQREWVGKTEYRCYVASHDTDAAPFKVLLGPFPNANAANYFIRRHRELKNCFQRKSTGLRFIAQ